MASGPVEVQEMLETFFWCLSIAGAVEGRQMLETIVRDEPAIVESPATFVARGVELAPATPVALGEPVGLSGRGVRPAAVSSRGAVAPVWPQELVGGLARATSRQVFAPVRVSAAAEFRRGRRTASWRFFVLEARSWPVRFDPCCQRSTSGREAEPPVQSLRRRLTAWVRESPEREPDLECSVSAALAVGFARR